TQCKYCKKRNLDCVRVVWEKRGRKSNETSFQVNVSSAIQCEKSSEQPPPKFDHLFSNDNEEQQLYLDCEFIDTNVYDFNSLPTDFNSLPTDIDWPLVFNCYTEEQLTYEQ
ncbi:9693_t:CDS:1, partial [Racocetra fulgida]